MDYNTNHYASNDSHGIINIYDQLGNPYKSLFYRR